MTDLPRLYEDLAYLWPLISPPEDYLPEAALIAQLLDEFLPPSSPNAEMPDLVEFGAGGGHTLHHLRLAFNGTAVDLSEAMLANCRVLNPEMPTVVGDMRTVDLGCLFDAVLIHDAVDYMQTENDARIAIQNAVRHLKPGGVLILAPTYVTETFVDGESAEDQITVIQTDDREGPIDISYRSTVHRKTDTTFELVMKLSVTEAGRTTNTTDRHHCGLFSRAAWESWLRAAHLDVTVREPAEGPATALIGVSSSQI